MEINSVRKRQQPQVGTGIWETNILFGWPVDDADLL
jgi:hypothetical protein